MANKNLSINVPINTNYILNNDDNASQCCQQRQKQLLHLCVVVKAAADNTVLTRTTTIMNVWVNITDIWRDNNFTHNYQPNCVGCFGLEMTQATEFGFFSQNMSNFWK